MPVTADQARQLASLAADMRPHGAKRWHVEGIVANLRKVAHLQLADVAMATIRAASNRAADNPGVIPILTGEHWHERVAERTGQTPPRRAEECEHHPGQRATNCGGCAADRLAGDETPPQRPRALCDPPAEYVAARAALDAARRSQTETEESQ